MGLIWGPILSKITQFFQNVLKFEPILAHIWTNFEKTTHSYTNLNLYFIRDHSYTKADFATHICGTSL